MEIQNTQTHTHTNIQYEQFGVQNNCMSLEFCAKEQMWSAPNIEKYRNRVTIGLFWAKDTCSLGRNSQNIHFYLCRRLHANRNRLTMCFFIFAYSSWLFVYMDHKSRPADKEYNIIIKTREEEEKKNHKQHQLLGWNDIAEKINGLDVCGFKMLFKHCSK